MSMVLQTQLIAQTKQVPPVKNQGTRWAIMYIKPDKIFDNLSEL